jgi:hypothetical protein
MDEGTQRTIQCLIQDAGIVVERLEKMQPTLRERYAMAALTGLCANQGQVEFAASGGRNIVDVFARWAFNQADAMLAFEKGEQK